MTWSSHKISTGAIAYALTGDLLATACALAGCVFPDAIEMTFQKRPKPGEPRRFSKHHRQLSHWPWSYVIVFAALFAVDYFFSVKLSLYASFLVLGSILHLLEDSLSATGIPWKSPYGRRRGLRVYKTFKMSETLTVFGIVALSLVAMKYRGFLDQQAFQTQLHELPRLLSEFKNEVLKGVYYLKTF